MNRDKICTKSLFFHILSVLNKRPWFLFRTFVAEMELTTNYHYLKQNYEEDLDHMPGECFQFTLHLGTERVAE
jgi:hypothetical protein